MKNLLVNLVEKNKKYTEEGLVASYIPALLKANKDDLGYMYCRYKIMRNTGLEIVMLKFTIQSISKVVRLIIST